MAKKPMFGTVGYADGSPFDSTSPDVLIVASDLTWRNPLRAQVDRLGYRALAVDGRADLLRLNRTVAPRVVVTKLECDGVAVIRTLTMLYLDKTPPVVIAHDREPPPGLAQGVCAVSATDEAALIAAIVEAIGAGSQDQRRG